MTRAWRICRAVHLALDGEGARLFGGRWNRPGRPMVYTADTPALAALEVRVHLDLPPDLLPPDFTLAEIVVGDIASETLDTLPDNPEEVGTEWLRSGRSAILRVPSVIVPECENLLLNPLHPDAAAFTIARTRPFRFDERLWQGG